MLSKLLRRTHMYAALFFMPWVLMYTLSTFVMNHRGWFRSPQHGGPPAFTKVSEGTWAGTLPADAAPRDKARIILASQGIVGAFGVQTPPDGRLIINRQSAIEPRRLTYFPDGRLLVERQELRANTFLERMHRRRGWQHGAAADNTWAFLLDAFLIAMIGWALSGLWLWWEMKATRAWGLSALAAGAALFALFLARL